MTGRGPGYWSRQRGEWNRERVRQYFAEHPQASKRECARALDLSPEAVGRHVDVLKAQKEAKP